MIHTSLRPSHSPVGTGHRRPPSLPMSPRFGKFVRPPVTQAKGQRKLTPAEQTERNKLTDAMKRLCERLYDALMPARDGKRLKRDSDIAEALDNIRVHNIESKKPAPVKPHTPFKPFRARA
ncbi:hypothetical protein SAMN02800691_0668 [Luteibacter sp. UNCMF366Tsu5.1]|nr:hypothetical protein SAMN02800691_0668 [Luteibacter sp. UNCMF366Tsu5.1]